ncbi:MAG: hypothetical protein HY744_11310, partial [Deltaproteobacteria bacterium]|nr:hypothetical protein [Deltaproteobacteria bacterium]
MANVRQGCGGVDTAQSPAPWVLRDARRWPLLVALLLAALLHVPMVPSRLMLLLRLFLAGPAEETGPMQEEVVMPVDLDVDFMAEPGEQAPGAAGPAAGQAGELVPEPPAAGAA